MAKKVTAEDLGLDDEYEEEEDASDKGADPDKDSSEAKIEGGPAHGEIGAEAVEKQVEESKKRQKEAEDEALNERNAKEGKDKDGKKLEYKDQEAAEKAVKEAKKKMTEATTKASKLQKINEDLEKKIKEASEASPTPKTPEANPFDVKRQKIADETLTKAAAVKMPVPPQDREDPEFDKKYADYQKDMTEYNGKVARIWAEAQSQIARVTLEEERQADQDREAVNNAVISALTEVELISDDTDPDERKDILALFWAQATDVPLEDQIKQTAEKCKAIVDRFRGKERKRAQEDKETRENIETLGRGTKVRETKKEAEGPSSMWAAQRAVLERRKLRHNP
jgi:hypothetical protein